MAGRARQGAGQLEWQVVVSLAADDLRFGAIRREVLRKLTAALLKGDAGPDIGLCPTGGGERPGGGGDGAGCDLRPGVNR